MNRHKTKKHLFLGIMLLFALLMLGGCSPDTDSTSITTTTATTPSPSATITPSTSTFEATSTTPSNSITASTPYYDLYTKDEKTYLHWTVDVPKDPPWSSVSYYLEFASVADLKYALLNGKFSKSDLDEIHYSGYFDYDKSTGDILICDPYKLCEPLYNGSVPEYRVEWYGKSYECYFSIENMSGIFFSYTREVYDQKILALQEERFGFEITDIKHDPVNNATEFYGKNQKIVRYTVQTETSPLLVCEYYSNNKDIPNDISVYGESNGMYFCYSFRSTMVTTDIISALSIKPLQP